MGQIVSLRTPSLYLHTSRTIHVENQFARLLLTPGLQSGVVKLSASAPLSHLENSPNI